MDDADYIIGLMRENTDAVGFIPAPAIRERWARTGNYVLQTTCLGRPRGYLLHGPAKPGRPLHINQACIDYDHRLRGFGLLAVREVLERAEQAGCTSLQLNCATDLAATHFWIAAGFRPIGIRPGGTSRRRTVLLFQLPLHQPRPLPFAAKIRQRTVEFFGELQRPRGLGRP